MNKNLVIGIMGLIIAEVGSLAIAKKAWELDDEIIELRKKNRIATAALDLSTMVINCQKHKIKSLETELENLRNQKGEESKES